MHQLEGRALVVHVAQSDHLQLPTDVPQRRLPAASEVLLTGPLPRPAGVHHVKPRPLGEGDDRGAGALERDLQVEKEPVLRLLVGLLALSLEDLLADNKGVDLRVGDELLDLLAVLAAGEQPHELLSGAVEDGRADGQQEVDNRGLIDALHGCGQMSQIRRTRKCDGQRADYFSSKDGAKRASQGVTGRRSRKDRQTVGRVDYSKTHHTRTVRYGAVGGISPQR
mmetsp:Transcript_24250/g.59861  ORF Transcript_24250/g.59861 Transcript_24250/m.59861 type:complete len:224 (+) Transcript_24250:13529-14200(+)